MLTYAMGSSWRRRSRRTTGNVESRSQGGARRSCPEHSHTLRLYPSHQSNGALRWVISTTLPEARTVHGDRVLNTATHRPTGVLEFFCNQDSVSTVVSAKLLAMFPGVTVRKNSYTVKYSTVVGFKRGKGWWGFGMTVASAGPYADNLHLTPDR